MSQKTTTLDTTTSIRDFPFNVIIGAPERNTVNNTTIGASISTLLTINTAADINEDESVNFDDLVILAENWLAGIAP